MGAQSHKTKTIDNSLDPVWDEYFEAVVDQASGQRIYIELFDEDVASSDEFLGRLNIELSVVRSKGVIDEVIFFQIDSSNQFYILFLVVSIGRREAWRHTFADFLDGYERRAVSSQRSTDI